MRVCECSNLLSSILILVMFSSAHVWRETLGPWDYTPLLLTLPENLKWLYYTVWLTRFCCSITWCFCIHGKGEMSYNANLRHELLWSLQWEGHRQRCDTGKILELIIFKNTKMLKKCRNNCHSYISGKFHICNERLVIKHVMLKYKTK